MSKRDFLSVIDLSPQEANSLLERAIQMKKGDRARPLAGKNIALLFEKPSLRTRASFDVGVQQLGGHAFYMGPQEVGLGVREPVADVARVLTRYVDGIVARVFAQSNLEMMAKHCTVPVINALSDWEHPCQCMADLQTVKEKKGRFKGITIAYVGDGNNTSRSLALGAALVGARFVIASPPDYSLDEATLKKARSLARAAGGDIAAVNKPADAAKDADVIYTDVWTSMGQEKEAEARRKAFRGFIVDARLMSLAKKDAIFMHDLPAHRGEEVADEVIEGPQSVVFDQAENRLHAQKAVMEFLFASR
jgi:ornithine carbamoyltransferase